MDKILMNERQSLAQDCKKGLFHCLSLKTLRDYSECGLKERDKNKKKRGNKVLIQCVYEQFVR